jgi:hypothetical protein
LEHTEGNHVGDKGCKALGNARWNNLITLNLSTSSDEDRQQQNRRKRVQVYLPRSMEKPANTLPMCCRPYLGQNSIEDKACLHLSKSRWKNLNSLYLCKRAVDKDCNKIKEAGCKSLTQAPWKNLRNLDLGSCRWS